MPDIMNPDRLQVYFAAGAVNSLSEPCKGPVEEPVLRIWLVEPADVRPDLIQKEIIEKLEKIKL